MSKFYSPLTWIGGKAKYWKQIKEQLPIDFLENDNNTFVDVFSGGSSVALNVFNENKSIEIMINDIDEHLYLFWNFLQNISFKELTEIIKDRPKTFEIAIEQYGTLDKLGLEPLKLFYRNNLTFNGAKKGTFSLKRFEQNFNETKWNKLINMKEMIDNNSIFNLDYELFVEQVLKFRNKIHTHKDILFYLDPPYYNVMKKNIYNYSNIDFIKLKNVCDKINDAGFKFLMTVDNTLEVKKIFEDYIQDDWDVKYTSTNIGGNDCKVGKELFIRNYEKMPTVEKVIDLLRPEECCIFWNNFESSSKINYTWCSDKTEYKISENILKRKVKSIDKILPWRIYLYLANKQEEREWEKYSRLVYGTL